MKATDAEKREMEELGYKGRKGILTHPEIIRCNELFKKYPIEYASCNVIGRDRADDEVNPFGRRK